MMLENISAVIAPGMMPAIKSAPMDVSDMTP